MSTKSTQAILAIQDILIKQGFAITKDGDIGPKTMAAMVSLDERAGKERLAESMLKLPEQTGKASFFAGPQDVRAFRACKREGRTDLDCFNVGDNGIGKWGHDCTSTKIPMAALPREIWQSSGKEGGDKLVVKYKGMSIPGILGDTLPSLANIHNGVIIDLNPAYASIFGISPEEMNNHTLDGVSWSWL